MICECEIILYSSYFFCSDAYFTVSLMKNCMLNEEEEEEEAGGDESVKKEMHVEDHDHENNEEDSNTMV